MNEKIRIIEKDAEGFLDELAARKAEDLDEVLPTVAEIIGRVRREGDKALAEYTLRFDRVEISPDRLRVAKEEIERAESLLEPELKEALKAAYGRICDYHRKQLANSWFVTGADGEILGQRIMPVDSAAISWRNRSVITAKTAGDQELGKPSGYRDLGPTETLPGTCDSRPGVLH